MLQLQSSQSRTPCLACKEVLVWERLPSEEVQRQENLTVSKMAHNLCGMIHLLRTVFSMPHRASHGENVLP